VPGRYTATYDVTLRGVRIGFETATVTQNAGGWQISSTGRLSAPIDLTTSSFELSYATDWQPRELTISGQVRGQSISLRTSFGLTTASVELSQGSQRGSMVQPITPRTIVLPNNFYAGYEALAARLATSAVGARLPIYVVPEREIALTVVAITPQRLSTPSGYVQMRQFDVTFTYPDGPVNAELWLDAQNHFARLMIPSQGLAVVRDDLSSLVARVERIRNPGEEDVFIPALGFNLAGTITVPTRDPDTRLPAVVLVAGPGTLDRDEAIGGIPFFGQLAGALAAAGYIVVRYDKRGVGLSGGRIESATLTSYVDDALSAVTWLRRRKDVDGNRIAIVGHGEGGALALLAAGRDKRLRGVALLGAPGLSGRDLTLEQQQYELRKLNLPDAEREAKIALQRQIVNAAATGVGWAELPAAIRRDADTPWFKSWILFDPAVAMKKVSQPILILHGGLDREIDAANADRLEALSRARAKLPATHTSKTVIAGANHLLMTATTGEVEEYPTLARKEIVPDATAALVGWLRTIYTAAR
jgi:pimeloyl-ACP methyl ester carboxylesterase